MITQAVIIAGGRGSRLGQQAQNLPKALVPVGDRPLLDHTLSLLQRHSVREVVFCTGHLSEKIETYVGDGSSWGLRVSYSKEPSPLGTAGCLRRIDPAPASDFLVVYADLLMELDLSAIAQAHRENQADATLLVHPNGHPYDSDLVDMDPATEQIREIFRKPHPPGKWRANLVSAAVYILHPRVLTLLAPAEKADCAHDLFPRALAAGYRLFGYRTAEYLKDIGTPERLREAEDDLRSSRVSSSRRCKPRPAVFLDRDGVINREVDLLHDPAELDLLPGASEAIKRLNEAGWLTVVVTNQPVVARGLCDENQVRNIHAKMEWLLGSEGAFVDAIYYCPHHPAAGYAGENAAYKVACGCRKPALGLIETAARDYNIDIGSSYFVGDTTTDLQTGRAAGMTSVLVRTGYGGTDKKYDVSPDHIATDLFEAVEWIRMHSAPSSPSLSPVSQR
jgi:mannose-1-phosphate guanylyltransferase/phosphomannomutase